jgi:hypothetical protein
MSKTGRALSNEALQLRHNVLIKFDRLVADCQQRFRSLPARTRRGAIGAGVIIILLLITGLSSVHGSRPPDSGLAGCMTLASPHHEARLDYRALRADFAGSRWQTLRTAGVAYAELASQLRTARFTDGYQGVSSYQRLAAACAQHGRHLPGGDRPASDPGTG